MTVALVKAHADLSASSAYRWMACGGSVRLSRGRPNSSSIYAIEGTIAHELAQKCLKGNLDPEKYIGLKLTDKESGTEVEITEEMAEHVGLFVNYCRGLQKRHTCWIERKFSLGRLNPPDDMYGTSDFGAYEAETATLEVVDLKYGQGVVVEVEENEQELYYGLGAVLAMQEEMPGIVIDRVRLTIVQPRIAHANGQIRSWEISIEELLAFASHLLDRARAALDPNASLVPGDHCRFCPAAGVCPALAGAALDAAQMDFSDVVDAPPAPQTLPADRIAQILAARPMITAFLNAVAAEALSRVEQGGVIPGFKAVPKKAMRKWMHEPERIITALASRGLTHEQIHEEPTIRSVAQLEGKVGKKKFAMMAADLVTKVSSGYTLAPIADVRPAALLGAQHDFEVVPNNAGPEETL